MKRWLVFIVTLTLVSTLAVAQAVVTPSGQATQQGAAVPVAPVSPPLVTTPLMHLGNAPTTAGLSTAAVTTPSATPEPPSAIPICPEIDLGPETVYVGPTATNAANNNANAPNATATVYGRQLFDRGVNSNADVGVDDGTHGRSLGEIARENRQRRMQAANAKTFTNADVERLSSAGGVSGIVTSTTNTTYPADNGVITQVAEPAVRWLPRLLIRRRRNKTRRLRLRLPPSSRAPQRLRRRWHKRRRRRTLPTRMPSRTTPLIRLSSARCRRAPRLCLFSRFAGLIVGKART